MKNIKNISLTILSITIGLFFLTNDLFAFEVTSKEIKEGRHMSKDQEFSSFGCDGKNIQPSLIWKNEPKTAKSFAITVYDPDAKTESGWWHWLLVNIPKNVNGISTNASSTSELPSSSFETINDFGMVKFGGACPPLKDGMHRYQFTVWALKVAKLDVTPETNPATIGYMLNANVIEKAVLTSTYSR